MSNQTQSEHAMPGQRSRLATMIDNLVAVQMDLKPLCADKGDIVAHGASRTAITEACEVLQSAIDELKQVIFELEGIPSVTGSTESAAQ